MPAPVSTPRHDAGNFRDLELLGRQDRFLVSRFSYGITPDLAKQVRRKGGAAAWLEWQLRPSKISDDWALGTQSWWPSLGYGPTRLWADNQSGARGGWQVMADYQRWVLHRRIVSKRQVQEVMTQFWETHLHVPTNGDPNFPFRKDYGDTIYDNALGSFEELLFAAATHPAMLVYLDQAVSTKAHPNENLARELLEIHTVGAGKYSERDVESMARILTGWRVDVYQTWRVYYDKPSHARGKVKVLGFKSKNNRKNGRQVTRQVLSYLARHPQTAQRIAHRLAVKFVSDNPPQALVDKLADVYLRNNTEIKPVLRALVRSNAFARAQATRSVKVRDPAEDVVATYRALGARLLPPTTDDSAANAILWQSASIGATPFSWPRPDGPPLDSQAWSSPSRLLNSLQIHYSMSGGWWPTVDIEQRNPRHWVPELGMRFDELVEHLSHQLLHRRSNARILQACSEAVGVRPGEKIDEDHSLLDWAMPRLLTVFLDSPDFLTR